MRFQLTTGMPTVSRLSDRKRNHRLYYALNTVSCAALDRTKARIGVRGGGGTENNGAGTLACNLTLVEPELGNGVTDARGMTSTELDLTGELNIRYK